MQILKVAVCGKGSFTQKILYTLTEMGHEIAAVISEDSNIVKWAEEERIHNFDSLKKAFSSNIKLDCIINGSFEVLSYGSVNIPIIESFCSLDPQILATISQEIEGSVAFGWNCYENNKEPKEIVCNKEGFNEHCLEHIYHTLHDQLEEIIIDYSRETKIKTTVPLASVTSTLILPLEMLDKLKGNFKISPPVSCLTILSILFARYNNEEVGRLFLNSKNIPSNMFDYLTSSYSILSSIEKNKKSNLQALAEDYEKKLLDYRVFENFEITSTINITMADNVAQLEIKGQFISRCNGVIKLLICNDSIQFILAAQNNTYKNFLNHFYTLLQKLIANPSADPWSMDILSKEEKNHILGEFNNTSKDFDLNSTINEKFEKQASLTPNNVAIEYKDEVWTYEQLNSYSNQLAYFINQKYGDLRGNQLKVGICLGRSPKMIAGIIASLKTGGLYIPFDRSYPAERLNFMVEDIVPDILILDNDFAAEHSNLIKKAISKGIKLINIIDEDNLIKEFPTADLNKTISPNDLAYIIYTSGSTGQPKGVMIRHSSILNLAATESIYCNILPNSRILNVASLGFDAAGWDIYGAIFNGASIVIAPEELRSMPHELYQFIRDKKITMATLTPAILNLMPRDKLEYLETLVVMGDLADAQYLELWAKNCTLINGYGPTEATIGATLNFFKCGDSGGCIGSPMHNYKAYILDAFQNMVPEGVLGELYLSGPGIAAGYYNRVDLTHGAFKICSFTSDPQHTTMYKTGDLVRWMPDGRIEFIGRADHQVKIRGVRIELAEIDNLLLRLPIIEQVVTIVTNDLNNKNLITFYTLKDKGVTSNSLNKDFKEHLQAYLHPSVIPSHFIKLETMPLNINGKIDRKVLEGLAQEESFDTQGEYVAPRDDKEKVLCSIFEQILSINHVSIFSNLFNLGGHSLTATQIAARINEHFSVNISAKTVFENPTVAQLAKIVSINQDNDISSSKSLIVERKEERVGPLTHAQRRLWYLYNLDPLNTAYNLPLALHFKGDLNIKVLEDTLNVLINRHESFKTIFQIIDDVSQQVVVNACQIYLEPIKIEQSELEAESKKFIKIPFALETAPPFRINLYELNQNEFMLLIVKHNIITDAWSEGILLRELSTIYKSLVNAQAYELPELEIQCVDVAFYQQKVTSKDLKKEITYWKNKLDHCEDITLPTDYIRPEVMNGSGYRYIYQFSRISNTALRNFATKQNTTLFVILAGTLKLLMARYTNQNDITIGTALAGRNISVMEKITGFFVNTIPLRTKLQPEADVKTLIKSVKETCYEAYDNQDLPYEWIVDQVGVKRSLNKTPLFQVMLILQNANEAFNLDLPGVKDTFLNLQTMTSMFDMTWNFVESEDNLALNLDFSTELYTIETIKGFIENFEELLINLITHTHKSVKEIQLLAETQQSLIEGFSKGEFTEISNKSLISLFEQKASLYPNKIALRTDLITYTYKELKQKVDTYSIYLYERLEAKQNNKEKNERIGLLMDRTADMVISILAITKAGGIYIPMDPEYPSDRLAYMIEDSDVAFILTDSHIAQTHSFLSTLSKPVVFYDDIEVLKKDVMVESSYCNDLAYIIYTSGSTGNPKGVMVRQESVVNLIRDFIDNVPCTENDKVLSSTSISFDIFALELWMPLLSGAELVLCTREVSRNPVHLVNYFNAIQPTIMQATPTIWSLIVTHLLPHNNKLKVLCGGEAMPENLLGKLQAISSKVLNVYGPTETTIWSTAIDLKNNHSITIGSPLRNTECFVLDDNLMLQPIGGIGELCIGGIGLARGYWHRDDLTKEKFVDANILTTRKSVYRTGDLVRLNKDGQLIYCGRKDFQIKIRGNRIELGEIESILLKHPAIEAVVVHAVGDAQEKRLIAYCISKDKSRVPDINELQDLVSRYLPPIMMPSNYVFLEAFPMTQNFKIDRKKLPIPDQEFASIQEKYVEPNTPLEMKIQQIWEGVLGIKNISTSTNFFMLGGNSLHIPIILSKLNGLINENLTIRDFILNSTIFELGKFIESKTINPTIVQPLSEEISC